MVIIHEIANVLLLKMHWQKNCMSEKYSCKKYYKSKQI
jgi:hypothetical protein